MSDAVTIQSETLTAQVLPFGAELISLKDLSGNEYMSDGNSAFWSGRAPLLFPIVGCLNGDRLLHKGVAYELEKHGFARRNRFAIVEQTASSVLFRLTDSTTTRSSYPFAFGLDMRFSVAADMLTMRATVRNSGDEPLPFSFGFHPAFAWPLPQGGAKLGHSLEFEKDEPADIRRLDDAGLVARSEASPVKDGALALHPDLFVDDAIIFDRLQSQRLAYRSPDGPWMDIRFSNTPMLGVWQKPGAPFICIEAWAGIADDAGFTGEFADKRGVMTLTPGAEQHFTMDVAVRHS